MNARFILRISDELHEKIKEIAKKQNISVNALLNIILEEYSGMDNKSRFEHIEKRIAELEQEVFKNDKQ